MYALFTGFDYYPRGGMNDYAGVFPTLETAKSRIPLDEWGTWANVAALTSDGPVTVATYDHAVGSWRDLGTQLLDKAAVPALLLRFEYAHSHLLDPHRQQLLAVSYGVCGSEPTDPVGIVLLLADDTPADAAIEVPNAFERWPVIVRRVPRAAPQ